MNFKARLVCRAFFTFTKGAAMGTFIRYRDWNPNDKTIHVVRQANTIIEEYAEDGYDLTLRQLYYQFVRRNWLKNNQKSYARLGDIVAKARDAGLIDWDFIVDRGRSLYGHSHSVNASHFLQQQARKFFLNWWEDQATRVQVWVEKDALSSVVHRACSKWDVDYFPCKGYMSASAIWKQARGMLTSGCERWVILHLGDHDPSGIDMSRDIQERLDLYSLPAEDELETQPEIEVRRIALNYDQVEEYGPPPNPAKTTDSRAAGYIDEFGNESWELDALEPQTLVDLIGDEIEALIDDREAFNLRISEQARIRKQIAAIEID